jgi:cytochrome P450
MGKEAFMTGHGFLAPRSHPFHPPEQLAEMRAGKSIARIPFWDGRQVWLITRYEDARFVLHDRHFSADSEKGLPALSPGRAYPRRSMSRMDDPRHGEIRRMLNHEFLTARVDELRPIITRIVETQIDRLLSETPPVDFHRSFALPVPSGLVSELLGVPEEEQRVFQETTQVLVSSTATKEEFAAADDVLYALCERLITQREEQPVDDLLGRLVTNEVATGRLGHDEACQTAKLLIIGGHDTTANMISLGLLTMIMNPGWAETLRTRPDVVPNAVEELLRFHTPNHDGVPRVALEDVMVGDTLIKAGDGLIVLLAASNRDDTVFPDPDTLDVERSEARHHLTFGHGTHNCLGKWFARAELQIALPAVATRIPTLRLAVPFEDLNFKEDAHIYGVHELPVAW